MRQLPRTEFSQALKAIASERGLDLEVILEAIKQAYIAAYKKDAKEQGLEVEEFEYDAEIDPTTGEASIIAWPTGKPEKKKNVTPPGFGRIAAQTAKQVIHQKIREAEKGVILSEFEDRVGFLISGTVLRFDGPNVRIDLGRTEGLMPASEKISSERLESGQRLTFLLKAIEDTPRGKQIILSRSDPEFVKAVFTREVPEINSKSVEIKAIAREAGGRTKIAVASSQPGVDPVGSCVGQKGVRVQAVTTELGGERVDIIPWSEDDKEFISAAFSPIEVQKISLNKSDKSAEVTIPEDELSLAIGKEGQNIRLTSQLTGWNINVLGDGKSDDTNVSEKSPKENGKKTSKESKPKNNPEKVQEKSSKKSSKSSKRKVIRKK